MRTFLAIFTLAAVVESFVINPTIASRKTSLQMTRYDPTGKHITFNPMEGYKGVDMKRAKECAENFGSCTVEEMDDLRANLHKERLQNFMFGGSGMTKPSEDAMEHLILEEELELQLALLKDHTPDTSLFPEDKDEMAVLPHLKDSEPNQRGSGNPPHRGPTPTQVLALEQSVLEENTLETAMFCLVMAAFIFVPQLLNHF